MIETNGSGVREATGRTRYLTTAEVAAFLHLSTNGVRKLIVSGRLPCERRRRGLERTHYLPTLDEVRAYLHAYDPALLPELSRRFTFNSERTEHT